MPNMIITLSIWLVVKGFWPRVGINFGILVEVLKKFSILA
jgi:hypothetical protein